MDIVKNAKRNIVFGVLNKAIMMLCPFIIRSIIVYSLNSEYLGLDSLFVSILTVLSLSEMGFSTAIVYHMYKPVAEGDIDSVNALLNFYKKAYRYIGICILLIGILITPFLPYLIKGTYPSEINIYILYFAYLANTVISYFMFAYMTSIIVVHQREDINSIRNSIVKVLLTATQISVLFFTKNYYLFVLAMPAFTIINNVWIAYVVKKQFPQYRCEGSVPKEKLSEIKKLVIGTFIQRACGVTRNSLDSICISAFLGLTLTAIYGNYYQISAAITAILGIVTTSFMGGIGNHVATKTPCENYSELKNIDFIYMWISGFCAACLLCLYQPFMTMWMGEKMILPISNVFFFTLYFYVLKLGDMRFMYTSAKGLWWEHRWRSIFETVSNLILNIVLGKIFGVIGIILATTISLIIFNFFWGGYITFSNYFDINKLIDYFKYHSNYAIVATIGCLISFFLTKSIMFNSLIVTILVRLFMCVLSVNLLYFLIYRKTKMFKYFVFRLREKNKR